MSKLVYDEWYGKLTFAQRAAYRKHNVSPADHVMLADHFGEGNHGAITAYVKSHSPNGSYRSPIFGDW